MSRFLRLLPVLLTFVAIALAAGTRYLPQANPDPNHTHADFAVWIGGKMLDFSGPEFMSGVSTDETTHPTDGLKKYLHLHDGMGTVIHRHKPGLTLREFFASIGTTFRVIENNNLCIDFPQIEEVCQDEVMHRNWVMKINDQPQSFLDTAYVFKDGDKILLFFEDGKETTPEQYKRMEDSLSDDACRYSKTCPWKGAPPAENCIADPAVPCME